MFRTLLTFRGLILVFGLVALGLPIALVGQLGIVRTLNAINQDVTLIREGELAAAEVLQLQIDEETGVRGYVVTRQALFLEPYHIARRQMAAHLGRLADCTAAVDVPGGAAAVRALAAVNAQWLRVAAEPLIAGTGDTRARQVDGKLLVDRFRARLRALQAGLAERNRAAVERRERTIRTAATISLLAITIIGFEAVVFALVIARIQHELDRERRLVETLQSVMSGRLVPPPHLALGSAYRSATRGTRVGGDVYDVYRLDPERTLLLIGDVSGKGLLAAVDTTFVRYAVRALAAEGHPPELVAARFDALYRDADGPPESFVTLFVAIHDRRDDSLVYVNAGHEACWVRRGARLEPLAPTGPLIGLAGLGAPAFAARRTVLGPGDLLVLATDGLTEARDPAGGLVPAQRVRDWILAADASSPQRLVDGLLAALTRYCRGRIGDDLALLAVARAAGKEEPPARSG